MRSRKAGVARMESSPVGAAQCLAQSFLHFVECAFTVVILTEAARPKGSKGERKNPGEFVIRDAASAMDAFLLLHILHNDHFIPIIYIRRRDVALLRLRLPTGFVSGRGRADEMLSSTLFYLCHPEQGRATNGSESASKDPENESAAHAASGSSIYTAAANRIRQKIKFQPANAPAL